MSGIIEHSTAADGEDDWVSSIYLAGDSSNHSQTYCLSSHERNLQ